MQGATPTTAALGRVRHAILSWYAATHRQFPWRRTRDPYAVLVSEVMLQQTQASRVAERFPRFMRRFATVEALATATTAEVLAEWNGLGYNRRAVALRRAAIRIVAAGWPRDVDALQKLPGVGPYTARAVASLAFGEPVGVVDTNVRRWLVRRFDVADRPRALQALADALAAPGAGDVEATTAWTHASMELGGGICRARSPRCAACPIADGCPSRNDPVHVAVARQPAFAGSDRALRGALLRALAGAPRHELTRERAAAALGTGIGRERLERVLAGLERDGLVTRDGTSLRLGAGGAARAARAAEAQAPVTTIGP